MIKNKEGFSLIFIMITLLTMTVCITNVWIITMCNHETIMQRLHYHKQLKSAEALLNYGIALSRANFDYLVAIDENIIQLSFQEWPLDGRHRCQAKLDLITDNSNIKVKVHMVTSNATTDLSCSVVKQINGNKEIFNVHHWNIGQD